MVPTRWHMHSEWLTAQNEFIKARLKTELQKSLRKCSRFDEQHVSSYNNKVIKTQQSRDCRDMLKAIPADTTQFGRAIS